MSESSVKNYIDYVQNVLGIKNVFYSGPVEGPSSELSVGFETSPEVTAEVVPEQTSIIPSSEKTIIIKPLIISVLDYDSYSDPELDLLNKMVAALQLNSQDYVLVSHRDVDRFVGKYHLHFVEDPTQATSTENHVYTFSPRRLLKQAALKKEAWTVMQNLIQKVKAKV